jgi:hypothetical protein
MKYSDGVPFRYSEAMWHNIKESLDRVGIDADTATVSYINQTRCPLRTELERLAQRYRDDVSTRIPTVREFIGAITDDIEKIAIVRDLFSVTARSWVTYLLDDERTAMLHTLLSAAETELREQVERVYHGSEDRTLRCEGAQHNASKPELRNYLLRLAKVWDELVVGKSAAPRLRNSFVWVCAVVCVTPETKITKRGVRGFLSSEKTKTTI